jgi:D-alanine-D-alanine ligase
MESAGIPTLPRRAVSQATEPGYKGPYIVKPRFGGSSIGIEIADDLVSARALAQNSPHLKNGAVLEPYKPNLVDLNIGFRTFPALELTDLEKPERMLQIKNDFEARKQKELANRKVNPLRVFNYENLDLDDLYLEEEGGGACLVCHK